MSRGIQLSVTGDEWITNIPASVVAVRKCSSPTGTFTQPPSSEAARTLKPFDPNQQGWPRLRTNFGRIRVRCRPAIWLHEHPDTSVRTHLDRRYRRPLQEKSASV